MTNETLIKIYEAYGLDVSAQLPMQSGYRNKNYPLILHNGKAVNLIIYKREYDIVRTIRNANETGEYLRSRDFPARAPFDPRILRVTLPPHEQFASLYEYLPGETIPWEGYTMNHLKSLGASMSSMHALLADQPPHTLPVSTDVYRALLGRMERYFSDTHVLKALSDKLDITIRPDTIAGFYIVHRAVSHLPNQQPIHLDFVRSNIIFKPRTSDITGVLDFEKVAFGNPIIDIARTLAFLLVDCTHKTEPQIRKYFLHSGYSKRGGTTYRPIRITTNSATIEVLESLIDFFLFYDLYKFLLHNPYESLDKNTHYTNTKMILASRGIL